MQSQHDPIDVAAFIRTVDTIRGQWRSTPRLQSMQTILGAPRFTGCQTTMQIITAATARHQGGKNFAVATTRGSVLCVACPNACADWGPSAPPQQLSGGASLPI